MALSFGTAQWQTVTPVNGVAPAIAYTPPANTKAILVNVGRFASASSIPFAVPADLSISIGDRHLVPLHDSIQTSGNTNGDSGSLTTFFLLNANEGQEFDGATEILIRVSSSGAGNALAVGIMSVVAAADKWLELAAFDELFDVSGTDDKVVTLATGTGPTYCVAFLFSGHDSSAPFSPKAGFTRPTGSLHDVGAQVFDLIHSDAEHAGGGNVTIGWAYSSGNSACVHAYAFREIPEDIPTANRIPWVAGGSAASNTMTLPSGWEAGQLAIVAAGNSTSVMPDLPAGWEEIIQVDPGGTFRLRVGQRRLQAGDTDIGNWGASTTHVCVGVYDAPFDVTNAASRTGTTATTNVYPSLTFSAPGGEANVVCFIFHGTANIDDRRFLGGIAPSHGPAGFASDKLGISHTPLPVSEWIGDDRDLVGAATAATIWIGISLELEPEEEGGEPPDEGDGGGGGGGGAIDALIAIIRSRHRIPQGLFFFQQEEFIPVGAVGEILVDRPPQRPILLHHRVHRTFAFQEEFVTGADFPEFSDFSIAQLFRVRPQVFRIVQPSVEEYVAPVNEEPSFFLSSPAIQFSARRRRQKVIQTLFQQLGFFEVGRLYRRPIYFNKANLDMVALQEFSDSDLIHPNMTDTYTRTQVDEMLAALRQELIDLLGP